MTRLQVVFKYDEADRIKKLAKENYSCLITYVSDRFGDYGLVGVLIYKTEKDRISVDTFLLSCRVLGRGVEHKILSELGSFAIEKGLNTVEINYLESKKNKPALDFIESFGKEFKSKIPDGFKYTFPAEFLKKLNYEPTSLEVKEVVEKSEKKNKSTNQVSGNYNDKLQHHFPIMCRYLLHRLPRDAVRETAGSTSYPHRCYCLHHRYRYI